MKMLYTFDKQIGYEKYYLASIIPCSNDDYLSHNVLKELEYKDYDGDMSYESIKKYINDYYINVLSKLDPEDMLDKVKYTIIVSDERNYSVAKRHIFSEWLSIFTGVTILESDYIDGNKAFPIEKPDFIRPILEDVIRENIINDRGFKSLRALYLFEQGEKLESRADMLEEKNNRSYDYLRQNAAYLRSDADMEEAKYKNDTTSKKLIKNSFNKKQIVGQLSMNI